MKSKHIFTGALLCLLLLASCSDSTRQPVDSDTDNSPTTTETEAVKYIDNLPEDLDFGGYEVRIFGGGTFSVTADDTADIVNDAVYRRNRAIEDRLNVTVTPITYEGNGWDVFVGLVTASVMAGSDEFDAVTGAMWWASTLSLNGMLYNLSDVPYIDIEQKWWATDYIRGLSYKDNIYWVTGPLDTGWIDGKMCDFVNLKLWNSLYPDEDIYQIVNDGKWTLDLLNQYINDVYQDLNGNGKVDEEDQVGFINESDMMVEGYAYAAGVEVAPFNEDGVPTLAITEESTRLVEFWSKMYPVRRNKFCLQNVWNGETNPNTNESSLKYFSEGHVLFVPGFLFNTTDQLRNMDDDYGILPMPKLDESQKNYLTVMKDSIYIYGMPKTVTEDGRNAAAAVLEAAAAEGYNTVTPIFYEDAFKNKYIRDERSIEIIDMMSENPICDFGAQYLDLGFHNFMRGLSSENIVSKLKGQSKVMEKKLASMLSALEGEA